MRVYCVCARARVCVCVCVCRTGNTRGQGFHESFKGKKLKQCFKAETIKRLSIRSTILFTARWLLHFQIHFATAACIYVLYIHTKTPYHTC